MTDSVSQFAIAQDDTSAARNSELESNRKLYQWYQHYLHPIPTLFNAKLGDKMGGATARDALEANPASAGTPKHFEDYLLSPEEHVALTKLVAEAGDSSEEDLAKTVAAHPAFAVRGVEADEKGVFGSDYDSQTGVPSAEVPDKIPGSSFLSLSYKVQRGIFGLVDSKITAGLTKNPPPLRGPADYQVLYTTYLAGSQGTIAPPGKKVLGFDGFPDLYNSDSFFAWQRVAGTNPRVLMGLSAARLGALLAKMPLTDAQVQAVAGAGTTVQGEAAAGRLFYCDYAMLAGLQIQQGRYLAPAIGIFWSDPKTQLLPVAIQLQQTPGRIVTPADADWPSARALFQIADFNYHEMGTHLSEAHFGQEAFVVAARRNLPSGHPIGALLGEIYWGLLFNNALGRLQLVNPGGYADRMMAGDLKNGSLKLVRDYYTDFWRWDDWDLELYLARQGTGDTTALPVYPYRDDGLPLWAAIKSFAAQYVDAWYDRDAVVANDRELGSFVSELVAPTMGNLATKGFPSVLMTKDALVQVLARLIWQASAGHGGINYSQWQYFAPVSNAAGAAYADFAGGGKLPDLMQVLPPIEQAIAQTDIINILTQKVFGSLGLYSSDFMSGLRRVPAAISAVTDFQQALKVCAQGVDQRNASGPREGRSYPFMNPVNLPNSSNI